MSIWNTSIGAQIEYPYKALADLVYISRPRKSDIEKAVSLARKFFDLARKLDYEVLNLKHENLRLKHENEFMLKLINDRSLDV